jgi:hypothetical protein
VSYEFAGSGFGSSTESRSIISRLLPHRLVLRQHADVGASALPISSKTKPAKLLADFVLDE